MIRIRQFSILFIFCLGAIIVFTQFQFKDKGSFLMKLFGTPDIGKIKYPKNKLPSKEEVKLGKALFFSNKLSKNENVSCASCHLPDKGFSSGVAFSVGTHGDTLLRNTPHLFNLAWGKEFFWDGRASSLEEQAIMVITSGVEMDMNFKLLVKRLTEDQYLNKSFDDVYPGKGVTKKNIIRALTAFERSIVSNSSPFDNYLSGDSLAISDSARKGLALFIGKANCVACHFGPNLTDNQFHNVGVITSDKGRQNVDRAGMKKEFEMTPYPFFSSFKAFKTPSLRNVALTAPYFHNGSEPTLKSVIQNYNKGGRNNDKTGLAKEIVPLGLSDKEIQQLISFLRTLTSPTEIN